MTMTAPPAPEDLPSAGELLRSTLLAACAAGALLVTVVLPAEFAVDPTGIGRALGLTQMGEIKRQLAAEASAPPPATAEGLAAVERRLATMEEHLRRVPRHPPRCPPSRPRPRPRHRPAATRRRSASIPIRGWR
jgi:hypothetical protein